MGVTGEHEEGLADLEAPRTTLDWSAWCHPRKVPANCVSAVSYVEMIDGK